jgi:signal transduction histidine kinase
MRRRLVTTYLALLMLVLLALEIPLAVSVATAATRNMWTDRLIDASGFAANADSSLRSGETRALGDQLARYRSLYGISAAVVNRDGVVVVGGPLRSDAQAGRMIRRALAGERIRVNGTVWPWTRGPLVVTVPVTSRGEVVGAVLLLSPTSELRVRVLRAWGALAAGGLAALAAFIGVAMGMARWMLRPIAELDQVTHRIAAGAVEARVPTPGVGPPELRRLAESFNDMADTLAAAMERQRAFAAQASHQLRNPLTSLRIRAETLAEETPVPGHRELVQEIIRFGDILEELLTLARLEQETPPCIVVEVGAVCRDRVAAWREVAAQRGVVLRGVECEDGEVCALAVPTAVDQALDALIDNATKFAGRGATVTVRAEQREDMVEVRVVDDGPGLSAQDLELATERFWRAPGARNIDGCGLGLPIVATLAEVSGGRLDLVPAEPSGLDVRLRLPAAG